MHGNRNGNGNGNPPPLTTSFNAPSSHQLYNLAAPSSLLPASPLLPHLSCLPSTPIPRYRKYAFQRPNIPSIPRSVIQQQQQLLTSTFLFSNNNPHPPYNPTFRLPHAMVPHTSPRGLQSTSSHNPPLKYLQPAHTAKAS